MRLGSRKCDECGYVHMPEPGKCSARKALPLGCPGCLRADCLDIRRDGRVRRGVAATLTCRLCGLRYGWIEFQDETELDKWLSKDARAS